MKTKSQNVRMFFGMMIFFIIGLLTITGYTQEVIQFNDPMAEMFVSLMSFMLAGVMGVALKSE
jgi:hypothetical protein